MPADIPPEPAGPHARGALGVFQLLGLGLALMVVLFVVIVVVRAVIA
jgi:hypothetical protein